MVMILHKLFFGVVFSGLTILLMIKDRFPFHIDISNPRSIIAEKRNEQVVVMFDNWEVGGKRV